MMHAGKWTCPVCQSQLKSPVVTTCGHTFCWPCLQSHLENSRTCPVCSASCSKENIVPIYGQAEEADISDIPPPPKQPTAEPPREEEQPRNTFRGTETGGGWHVQYGFMPFGFGATFQFGGNLNGGNHQNFNRQPNNQRPDNSKFMRISITVVFLILVNVLLGH